MARPPRIEFPGALYHVTSRGNARRNVFLRDADRLRFLEQLERCLEHYDVRLFAYVLMDNHYHLFAQTRRANLSRFCQRLNTSYALYARYRQKRPGHIFQGRYKAKLVQDESYLPALTRYIHLNPVKTRRWRSAPAAERERFLRTYRWSSLPGYLRASAEQAFVCYDALLDFGADRGAARRAYRRFIAEKLVEDDPEALDALGASPHAVGGRAFVDKIEKELAALRTGGRRDADLALPKSRGGDLKAAERLVCEALGVPSADLRRHGNSAASRGAREIVVEVTARATDLTLRRIGERYGLSPSGVTMARKRLRTPAWKKRLEQAWKLICQATGKVKGN